MGTWQALCFTSTTDDTGAITGTSGNNATVLKRIKTIPAGTYQVSGSGVTYNAGGGGIDAVFLSSTLYPDGNTVPPEVAAYQSLTTTGAPSIVSYPISSGIIYATKRYGAGGAYPSPESTWTIPANTVVTLSTQKYMYIVLGQARATGSISFNQVKACGTPPVI